MSQSSHISSVVITPATLKEQIIIRILTLLNKQGGYYYPKDNNDNETNLAVIEGMEIRGLEVKDRNVYLMTANIAIEDELVPYNANEFYIEQLWGIYLACEPIYISKFTDYGAIQD